MAKKNIEKEYKQLIEKLDQIAKRLQDDDKKAVAEAADIISDYSAATTQTARMMQHYEAAAAAVTRAPGVFTCPACGRRINAMNDFCHWCGKKLSWERQY